MVFIAATQKMHSLSAYPTSILRLYFLLSPKTLHLVQLLSAINYQSTVVLPTSRATTTLISLSTLQILKLTFKPSNLLGSVLLSFTDGRAWEDRWKKINTLVPIWINSFFLLTTQILPPLETFCIGLGFTTLFRYDAAFGCYAYGQRE